MRRLIVLVMISGLFAAATGCGPYPPPKPPENPVPTAIVSGAQHTCALLDNGTVTCWGYNYHGQLGNTTNNGTFDPNSTPTPVPGLKGVTQIAAGDFHTCALLGNGTVKCWGANGQGQLGSDTNNEPNDPNPTPIPVAGLSGVSQLAGGFSHTCALLNDGSVTCWGSNVYGELGNTTNNGTLDPNPPTAVSGLSGVAQITSGFFSTCALVDDGTATCWGNNGYGQLGNHTNLGGLEPSPNPTPVAGLEGVSQIAAQNFHVCALIDNGTVTCWGDNDFGQLGNDTNTGLFNPNPNPDPTAVEGLAGVTKVVAGANHTCARLTDGTATCWGDNQYGQLGNDTNNNTTEPNPTPAPVAGLSGITQLTAGNDHTCALLDDDTVTCWGLNLYGQLGNYPTEGTENANPTPTPVVGLTP